MGRFDPVSCAGRTDRYAHLIAIQPCEDTNAFSSRKGHINSAWHLSVCQCFVDQDIRSEFTETLEELSPELHVVVVLKHLQGLSYREIAEILEIPEERVKSRLFSARQRLRQLLEKRGVTA